MCLARPELDAERLRLYERHKRERGLSAPGAAPIRPQAYRRFLVDTCVDSYELRYLHEGQLIGVAIVDRGESALSAVYCCYDPSAASALKLSLGTYSIMRQVALAQRWGLRYLYLGLYIADNASMAYKACFRPHERRIDGEWVSFER